MNTKVGVIPGLHQVAARENKRSSSNSKDAGDHLATRQSKELVVALSGPIGAGVPDVQAALKAVLQLRGYNCVHVKVSGLFDEHAERLGQPNRQEESGSESYVRISNFQNLGNDLRKQLGDDMGAQLAIKFISIHRTVENSGVPLDKIEPGKTVYIIDQLKHPREVALLRAIYGEMFFMVGVLSSYERRKAFLFEQGMTRPEAETLIERDRKESDDNGQQLDKTLHHADFFVSHSRQNMAGLRESLTRFVELIHGQAGHSPNAEERGMFAAYNAGLRSACLSRQVGAAIADSSGNVISTGCNDVPRAGGGLYEPGPDDRRCAVKFAYCHNDKHKNILRDQINRELIAVGVSSDLAGKAVEAIGKNTRVKDLIEFSRAVHAEMDAIIGIARTGVTGIQGATLFTTVYPCHNCARHIIAAGVSRVIFIEPYEKSLASQLHNDSIFQESDASIDSPNAQLVQFVHFEGVSPHKFSRLFQAQQPRKDKSGKALESELTRDKRYTEYLDDYIKLEIRVVDRLDQVGGGNSKPPTAA